MDSGPSETASGSPEAESAHAPGARPGTEPPGTGALGAPAATTPAALAQRTRFEPGEVEPRILERWLASGIFHAEPPSPRPAEPPGPSYAEPPSPSPGGSGPTQGTYSIAIPPPNITGSLHMGHALNGSIQDVLIRYHRMRGATTKWIFGTDHAGIATQTQVERALEREGKSRAELGREAFEERVWEWRAHYGSTIVDQFKRLGASCDYEDERFTLDPGYVEAVRKVFVTLFDKGYIYRDRYLVNWDPGTGSAVSDLEVDERVETDELVSIRYDLKGGGELTIATVRPETMLADTAVAVNPGDSRYSHLVGGTAILPLVGRELPIVADDYVKPEFGTGALKVTPGHDLNDFDIGLRHDLPQITVIGEDGRLTAEAGPSFAGLTVAQARAAVLSALEAQGRIVSREPYKHAVPISHRSGARIEPLISLQWFMRMDELAAGAIAAVEDGRVRIVPDNHRRVYLEWLQNIRPWCISRQLWWGHRIPVYYCDACEETYVSVEAPERCGACGGAVHAEDDVLDTWFSSALWPFATLGWPRDTPELPAFYPTNVLSTARDILFLWVARMVMMGLEFTGQAPFSDVYIHSVIQAPDGRRMSKSLGTGIDPLEEIDRHGADAVRFGLLAMSSTQDVRYSAEKVQQGERLANKLFNAVRLVLMRVDTTVAPQPQPRTLEDRWILSRLQRMKTDAARRIESYAFSHLAFAIYDFVFGELCDWYLELVKSRLDSARGSERAALSATLLHVVRETLALAHPVIPFVTEELWSAIGEDGLLAGASYPQVDESLVDERAEASVGHAIEAIKRLRTWREDAGVKPATVLEARLEVDGYDEMHDSIARLARLDLQEVDPEAAPIASVTVPGGTVDLLGDGDFDLAGAEQRRTKRRKALETEITRVEGRLSNQGFLAKAPQEVIDGERTKLSNLQAELEGL